MKMKQNPLYETACNLYKRIDHLELDKAELVDFARRVVVWAVHGKTGGVLDFEDIENQARAALTKAK